VEKQQKRLRQNRDEILSRVIECNSGVTHTHTCASDIDAMKRCEKALGMSTSTGDDDQAVKQIGHIANSAVPNGLGGPNMAP